VAGTNVTLTPSGTGASRQITIAATGGGGGSGDVTAAANFEDEAILRGDGSGKGAQKSPAFIDDNGTITIKGDGVQGSVTLADAHATDPKSISITVPATITNPYRLVLPGVIPTAGQVMRVASVAGAVVTLEHITPTVASIVPNTAPSAGQILVGNAGGTAYAPVAASGDATLASTGAITLASKHLVPALSALTFASTLDLAFTEAPQRRSLALTGNITFTGSGYADKYRTKVFVAGDTVSRTLAFPSGWVFVGAKPTELAANKNAVFSLECTSGSESGVRCAWGVQT